MLLGKDKESTGYSKSEEYLDSYNFADCGI
jgi:hypothetical protein